MPNERGSTFVPLAFECLLLWQDLHLPCIQPWCPEASSTTNLISLQGYSYQISQVSWMHSVVLKWRVHGEGGKYNQNASYTYKKSYSKICNTQHWRVECLLVMRHQTLVQHVRPELRKKTGSRENSQAASPATDILWPVIAALVCVSETRPLDLGF